MSSKRKRKDEEKEKYPRQLALAEKWAKQLDKKVQRANALMEDKKQFPILIIKHGAHTIITRVAGKSIQLALIITVADESKKKISTLEPTIQQKMYITLRNQLLSNSRTSFIFNPRMIKHILDINEIYIQQQIRLEKDEIATFNRFADAIQEIVTVAARALLIFGMLNVADSTAGDDRKPPEVPETMYA